MALFADEEAARLYVQVFQQVFEYGRRSVVADRPMEDRLRALCAWFNDPTHRSLHRGRRTIHLGPDDRKIYCEEQIAYAFLTTLPIYRDAMRVLAPDAVLHEYESKLLQEFERLAMAEYQGIRETQRDEPLAWNDPETIAREARDFLNL
jgi:hypothetical protein